MQLCTFTGALESVTEEADPADPPVQARGARGGRMGRAGGARGRGAAPAAPRYRSEKPCNPSLICLKSGYVMVVELDCDPPTFALISADTVQGRQLTSLTRASTLRLSSAMTNRRRRKRRRFSPQMKSWARSMMMIKHCLEQA